MDLMARRRMLFAHIKKLVHRTITSANGLVNFKSNVEMPLKVTCEFSPVQEGTGDSSPDNVRPISGWTGCEILHTGKNLSPSIDDTVFWNTAGYLKRDGTITYRESYRTSAYLPVAGGHQYVFSTFDENENARACWNGFLVYDSNKQPIQDSFYERSTAKVAITVPEGGSYVRIYTQLVGVVVHRQLELGSTATAYEPYQGATLPITFTDPNTGDPLTVYGGTVTLNEDGSADVTATWFYGTPNYSALGSTSYSKEGYRNAYNYMNGGALKDFPLSANHTKIISDKAVRGSFSTTDTNSIVMQTSSNYIYFGVKSELLESDNLTGLRAYLVEHAPAICYPLKQEDYITYHFDNIGQLQSFLGTNNIWHNMNGDITVEYYNYQ